MWVGASCDSNWKYLSGDHEPFCSSPIAERGRYPLKKRTPREAASALFRITVRLFRVAARPRKNTRLEVIRCCQRGTDAIRSTRETLGRRRGTIHAHCVAGLMTNRAISMLVRVDLVALSSEASNQASRDGKAARINFLETPSAGVASRAKLKQAGKSAAVLSSLPPPFPHIRLTPDSLKG